MSIATSYATALYEVVAPLGEMEIQKVEDALLSFSEVIQNNQQLKKTLNSPAVERAVKQAILVDVLSQLNSGPILQNLVAIMVEKNRIKFLTKIVHAWMDVRSVAQGFLMGELVSAQAIAIEELRIIEKLFTDKFAKKVTLKTTVDSNLIAGLKVTISGVTYDGTIQYQLGALRNSFQDALKIL
jgi:F-type H+-transporting ATPase subunit delta